MNGTDKCHGISQEKAESEGIDIKDVLTQFRNDIDNHCMKLVCHNVNFDVRVVASEFVRAEMEIPLVKTCCTMNEGVNYCKITPKVYGELNGHRYNNYIANVSMKNWRMFIIATTMLLIVVPNVISEYVVSE